MVPDSVASFCTAVGCTVLCTEATAHSCPWLSLAILYCQVVSLELNMGGASRAATVSLED